MTRKDFELLAAWAAAYAPEDTRMAESLADVLATTNPRFDRQRFLQAAHGR